MDRSEIEVRVCSIVSQRLGVASKDVRPDSAFIEELGADSLEVVELVMELEEAFDTEIPDDAVEGILTVGDAVRYLTERVG